MSLLKRLSLVRTVILCCLVLLSPISSAQDKALAVVVNQASELNNISKKQLRYIYMGSTAFDVVPVNLARGSRLRTVFNTLVLGLTESRIRAFWMQMKFTGRGRPPMEMESQEKALEFVQHSPKGIAYVSAGAQLPSDVRVIFTIEFN